MTSDNKTHIYIAFWCIWCIVEVALIDRSLIDTKERIAILHSIHQYFFNGSIGHSFTVQSGAARPVIPEILIKISLKRMILQP